MMQRDLSELGWQGAEAGMKRALDHAEREESEWGAHAFISLCQYLAQNPGREFIVPEVRVWSEEHGLPKPATNWAWGSVIAMASRRGIIEKCGHSTYGDATAHTRAVVKWRQKIVK